MFKHNGKKPVNEPEKGASGHLYLHRRRWCVLAQDENSTYKSSYITSYCPRNHRSSTSPMTPFLMNYPSVVLGVRGGQAARGHADMRQRSRSGLRGPARMCSGELRTGGGGSPSNIFRSGAQCSGVLRQPPRDISSPRPPLLPLRRTFAVV